MRIYERQGAIGNLRALGLRIARGEPPFDKWRSHCYEGDGSDETRNMLDDLNACLALTVQHADEKTLAELSAALPPIPQVTAGAQIARRMNRGWKPDAILPVPWVNLPEGVSALACNDTVLSLAADGRRIYAGMPWGVAVYDHAGHPEARIAMAAAVEALELHEDILWAGTSRGVYQVAIGSWKTRYLPLDTHLDPREREQIPRGGRFVACHCMAFDGRYVWMGTSGGVQRFEPGTDELRVFMRDEMGGTGQSDAYEQFILDGNYLWLSSDSEGWRYSRETETWDSVVGRPLTLDNGTLWGDVWIDKQLGRRPCAIDRETLEIRPIPIDTNEEYSDSHHMDFIYTGTWQGHATFEGYAYDSGAGVLRHLDDPFGPAIESLSLRGLSVGGFWRRDDGTLACYAFLTRQSRDQSIRTCMVTLPSGTTVLGRARFESPGERSLSEEYEARTGKPEGAGLYLISPDYAVNRVSSAVTANSLPGDSVFMVAFDDAGNGWIPTDGGIAVVDEAGVVLTHFAPVDGVPIIPTVDAAVGGGSVYFASAWGDDSGCLVRYDLGTAVFTRLVEADGLATNNVTGVIRGQDGELVIEYEPEYIRFGKSSGKYRVFLPSTFDPESLAVIPGGPGRIVERSEVEPTRIKQTFREMPFLGGCVLRELEHDGRKYLCGTRGVVIMHGPAVEDLADVEVITPKAAVSSEVRLMRAAQQTKYDIKTPEDLARYLEDDNPFVRATALVRAGYWLKDSGLPQFAVASSDPDVWIRGSAVYALQLCEQDEQVAAILVDRLQDTDPGICAAAALELAKRKHPPGPEYLEHILECNERIPCGTQYEAATRPEEAYPAWAPYADENMFKVFMKYPPYARSFDYEQTVFPQLGASLLRHPEAANLLLKAQDENYTTHRREFAREVFRFAGTEMLPVLYVSLKSDDPVVRANAAHACGAIGDVTSIPLMRDAMALGDKGTLVAVVEGLCFFPSTDAIAPLVEVYVTADKETAELRGKVNKLMEMRGINNAAIPPPLAEVQEELRRRLLPQDIEHAVMGMKPQIRQCFYRLLAQADTLTGKSVAIRELGNAKGDDVEKNVTTLQGLLKDSAASIRMEAAAILINLGSTSGEGTIIEGLVGKDNGARDAAITWLRYVRNPANRQFAREHLGRIISDASVDADVRARAADLL